MEEQQAIEQFEKAKGVTKRNQKIFATNRPTDI